MKKLLLVFNITLWMIVFPAAVEAKHFKRAILVIYNSNEGATPASNFITTGAETFLNYLGLVVDFHNANSPLPGDKQMSSYRGVVSCFFSSSLDNPLTYINWAAKQLDAGRKFIILGNPGVLENPNNQTTVPRSKVNQFLRKVGVTYRGNYTNDPQRIELVYKDPAMVEYERSLDYEIKEYESVTPVDKSVKSYLTLRLKDTPQSDSVLVATSDSGGYVWGMEYLYYVHSATDQKKYRVNPYLFFEKALDLEGKPRLDVTTLCGNRVFYSHIDGDGFSSLSLITPKKFSAEIIKEKILEAYPQLPVGVSFIAGEIEYNKQPQRAKKIAKGIFALKNVEPASHTYSHPLTWKSGQQAPSTESYSFGDISFSLKNEILGSIDYLNKTLLKESGKKIETLYWSGDCDPPPEALKLIEDNKLLAINGGDSRKDKQFPSYTYVYPLTSVEGKYRQIYSSNSNENTYTNLWTGPYFGFKHVKITWQQTDSPLRLLPINHYYHFYSGERYPSLKALISNIEYALKQEINPVFPSRFIHMVKDFHSADIEETATGFRFSNLGECRTVRFDDTSKHPDLKKSQGIMGYRTHNNSLYIAIDPDIINPEIYLTPKTSKKIYLINAGCRLGDFKSSGSTASFWAEGFGTQQLSFFVPAGGKYRIKFYQAKSKITPIEVKSVKNKISFELELKQKRFQVIIEKL